MDCKILYLGDTALDRQAGYLAGVMAHYGLDFDYVASDEPFSDVWVEQDYQLMILSDYPASNFSDEQLKRVVDKTKEGMGLLMIGGWESFVGIGGDYHRTPIQDVLPVVMKDNDDRINFSGPCLVVKEKSHETINSLPLDQQIPAIGGLNAVEAKPGSTVLLSAVQFKSRKNKERIEFEQNATYPLLVLGNYGLGRTAAFTSDVAPHWVGPLVDWGDERIRAQADGAEAIEVGNWYAAFFAGLMQWLCVGKISLI